MLIVQTCRAAKLCKRGSDEVHGSDEVRGSDEVQTKTVPVDLASISTVVILLIVFIFDIELVTISLYTCPIYVGVWPTFMWACCCGLSASPSNF